MSGSAPNNFDFDLKVVDPRETEVVHKSEGTSGRFESELEEPGVVESERKNTKKHSVQRKRELTC